MLRGLESHGGWKSHFTISRNCLSLGPSWKNQKSKNPRDGPRWNEMAFSFGCKFASLPEWLFSNLHIAVDLQSSNCFVAHNCLQTLVVEARSDSTTLLRKPSLVGISLDTRRWCHAHTLGSLRFINAADSVMLWSDDPCQHQKPTAPISNPKFECAITATPTNKIVPVAAPQLLLWLQPCPESHQTSPAIGEKKPSDSPESVQSWLGLELENHTCRAQSNVSSKGETDLSAFNFCRSISEWFMLEWLNVEFMSKIFHADLTWFKFKVENFRFFASADVPVMVRAWVSWQMYHPPYSPTNKLHLLSPHHVDLVQEVKIVRLHNFNHQRIRCWNSSSGLEKLAEKSDNLQPRIYKNDSFRNQVLRWCVI